MGLFGKIKSAFSGADSRLETETAYIKEHLPQEYQKDWASCKIEPLAGGRFQATLLLEFSSGLEAGLDQTLGGMSVPDVMEIVQIEVANLIANVFPSCPSPTDFVLHCVHHGKPLADVTVQHGAKSAAYVCRGESGTLSLTEEKVTPAPPQSPEETARAFISQHIPQEYPKSDIYKCEVAVENGRVTATLALDISGKELGAPDALEITKLETGYLLEEVLRNAPLPIDYVLVYFKDGQEFARVIKPFGFAIATRLYQGKSDQFSCIKS